MPEQTPEQIGREAGEAVANAIADKLEVIVLSLTEAIALMQAEQARLRQGYETLYADHLRLVDVIAAHQRQPHGG